MSMFASMKILKHTWRKTLVKHVLRSHHRHRPVNSAPVPPGLVSLSLTLPPSSIIFPCEFKNVVSVLRVLCH